MTDRQIQNAKQSVATPEFEALLGERPEAGHVLTPAGVAHLCLRAVKWHLLMLAEEVERLQAKVTPADEPPA